jgi:hypothetical protein
MHPTERCQWLATHPELRRYVSICWLCKRDGIKSDMELPDACLSVEPQLKRLFVALDHTELCRSCRYLVDFALSSRSAELENL